MHAMLYCTLEVFLSWNALCAVNASLHVCPAHVYNRPFILLIRVIITLKMPFAVTSGAQRYIGKNSYRDIFTIPV